jgi:hypothetical protein
MIALLPSLQDLERGQHHSVFQRFQLSLLVAAVAAAAMVAVAVAEENFE